MLSENYSQPENSRPIKVFCGQNLSGVKSSRGEKVDFSLSLINMIFLFPREEYVESQWTDYAFLSPFRFFHPPAYSLPSLITLIIKGGKRKQKKAIDGIWRWPLSTKLTRKNNLDVMNGYKLQGQVETKGPNSGNMIFLQGVISSNTYFY